MEFTRENGKVIKCVWQFNVCGEVGWSTVVRSRTTLGSST